MQALKHVTVIVVFDQIVRGIILGNGYCFTLIFFIQFDLIQKLCFMIFFDNLLSIIILSSFLYEYKTDRKEHMLKRRYTI